MQSLICRSRVRHGQCYALIFPDSGSSGNPSEKRPGRIILPNEGGPPRPRSGSKLVIPGQDMSAPRKNQEELLTETDGTVTADGRRTFNPPVGYFTKRSTEETVSGLDPEIMLQKLSAGIGLWHTIAKYIPQLAALGYDSVLVEQLTGITKGEQNILATAASVFQSITDYVEDEKPDIPDVEEILSFYDREGSHFALSELRFLEVDQRVACAVYIAQEQLEIRDTRDLAKATKEYYRRQKETEGFSTTPKDILAFKFYRYAIESRDEDMIKSFVEEGIEIADTETARERLEVLLTDHDKVLESSESVSKAKIEMYRLLTTDLLFRPIPFAGDITQITCDVFETAPWASQSGEFGIFQIHNQETRDNGMVWKWMALPNWPLLSKAKRPTTVGIRNCSKVEAIVSSAKAKTEDELRKLAGPGMLVADLADQELKDSEFYLIKSEDNKPVIRSADQLNGEDVDIIGRVLLLCRPPDKESIDSFEI